MILGAVSIIMGLLVLILSWPISLDSLSAIVNLLILILLVVFGSRIFYVDFKQYLYNKKEIEKYLNETKLLLDSNQIPKYPNSKLISHKRILKEVTTLIKNKKINDAQLILNNDVAFYGAKLRFAFFAWLFKEDDQFRNYHLWKKTYQKIHAASYEVIKDLVDDLKQGHYLVDVLQYKGKNVSTGSYVLKVVNQTYTLEKLPVHIRHIQDDFYGHMIYDQAIDQKPYTFKFDDILTKKEQHVKQTTNYFLDIDGHRYKKDSGQKIKSLRIKLKNEDSFDLIGYQLPF